MRYSAALTNFTPKSKTFAHIHTYKYEDYMKYIDSWMENGVFKKELEGGIKLYFIRGVGMDHNLYVIPETHPLFNYTFVPDDLLQYRKDYTSFYNTIKKIVHNMLT